MRDLDACKAEVFRRSEHRIRQRRKRILTVCIPLTVCIALFASMTLPGFKPEIPQTTENVEFSTILKGEKGTEPIYSYANGLPNASCKVARIQVTGADAQQSYTDAAKIQQIVEQLQAYTLLETEEEDAAKETAVGATGLQDDQLKDFGHNSDESYTITLIAADGSKEVYYLSDSVLKTQKESVALTREQLEVLKELLGIE